MKILYIFPHPDDEAFGPAAAISYHRRVGHDVFLLTLTKGGATKERLKYNYTVKQMGEVRYAEMQQVEKVHHPLACVSPAVAPVGFGTWAAASAPARSAPAGPSDS